MYWNAIPIWNENETVFIIGGGPSIRYVNFDLLRGKPKVAANAAFQLPNVSVCFFGDIKFWNWFENELLAWRGLIVTNLISFNKSSKVKVMKRVAKGISPKSNTIAWNTNSGAASINLAYHLGARKVALVGFDMKRVNGENNYHSQYIEKGHNHRQDPAKVYERMLGYWRYIAIAADKLNLEIVNTTEDSAIKEFPYVKLEKLL